MSEMSLHIIGLGVSEKAELSSQAKNALRSSCLIIGWARHRQCIAPYIESSAFNEVKKLSELKKMIAEFEAENNQGEGKNISIVASGDPLYYGIGFWFTKHFSKEQLFFYPAVSSVQSACHKQGLPIQDVNVVSLHGRPLQKIRTQLKKNSTLLILTDKYSSPQILAKECIAAGFADSTITVHEMLGYQHEVSTSYNAKQLSQLNKEFDPLHVTIIQTKGEGGVLPEFPGIPDDYYVTGATPGKGMITKREVRLLILSLMQPGKGDVIWDIGAGCGGVSVELCYWNEKLEVHAIEHHVERLDYLRQNREKFGVVQNLHIVSGKAPQAFYELPRPNKIFIGGSDGELENLLEQAWALLPEGGCLLASGVLESSRQQLRDFSQALMKEQAACVESVELGVKRGALVDEQFQYEIKKPVEVFKFTKSKVGS